MSKLNTYRDKDTPDLEEIDQDERTWWDGYREGFDAAIKLELPVKFGNWLMLNYEKSNLKDQWITKTMLKDFGEYNTQTTKELYQYWIDNVFNPESS